jgi:hypothetical protein
MQTAFRRHMASGTDSCHLRDHHAVTRLAWPACLPPLTVTLLPCTARSGAVLTSYIPLLPLCSCSQRLGSRALQSPCCLPMRALTRTTLHEQSLLPSSLDMPVFALAAVLRCSVHAPSQPCEPCSGRHASLRPSHPSTTRHVHHFTSTPLRDAPMLLTLTRDAMQLGV